jgi:hypothetical protein
MKVILIVLILLIPAWCYADGNELLSDVTYSSNIRTVTVQTFHCPAR